MRMGNSWDLSNAASGTAALQNCTATWKNCLAISYKIKYISTVWLRNSIYSRGVKIHVQKKNRKKMFIAALLIIAITEKKTPKASNTLQPKTGWKISAIVTQWNTTRQWKGACTQNLLSEGRETQNSVFCITLCILSPRRGKTNEWWQKSIGVAYGGGAWENFLEPCLECGRGHGVYPVTGSSDCALNMCALCPV